MTGVSAWLECVVVKIVNFSMAAMFFCKECGGELNKLLSKIRTS
jgi:hypothetical protein